MTTIGMKHPLSRPLPQLSFGEIRFTNLERRAKKVIDVRFWFEFLGAKFKLIDFQERDVRNLSLISYRVKDHLRDDKYFWTSVERSKSNTTTWLSGLCDRVLSRS